MRPEFAALIVGWIEDSEPDFKARLRRILEWAAANRLNDEEIDWIFTARYAKGGAKVVEQRLGAP